MNIFKSKVGFTLIELLVVIGILAVLAAIAIPSVAGLIDRANVSADKTNANEMTNAMERFAAEYELYCQDIASGVVKADTTDFDAAQGRVYNVTGALSRSDIETLEVAQGATVADDQIAIYRDTKYPVNAMTAKSIVMNYTKTSSSTFEPKQSDMHFWYSPDCGVVVFAEPNADVVTQLNAQILSGKDAKGNELGASTKWIDLTADTTAVGTHAMLNKTDVLTGHNEAYFRSAGNFDNFVAVKVDGNVVDRSNYTLSEGSTVVVLKPEFVQTLSEGEHTMEIQSTDGSAVCDFTVTAPENHGLYFGCPYVGTIDGITVEAIIYEDSALMFKIGEDVQNIPSGIVVITKETIDMTGIDMGIATISPDGKTIYADGGIVLKLIEEDWSTLEGIKNIEYRMPILEQSIYIMLTDKGMEIYYEGHRDEALIIPTTSITPMVDGFELHSLGNGTIVLDGQEMPMSEFETTYTIYDNNDYILVNFDGELGMFALRETACKHKAPAIASSFSCWRYLRDKDGNVTDFYSINLKSIEDLYNYEVFCGFCGRTIDSYISGNYMYIENTYLEPQLYNGSSDFQTYPCKDMSNADVGGFVAIPIDGAKTDGLLSTVKGKPVTAVYIFNHMTISSNTKYIMGTANSYNPNPIIEPIFEITYQGTTEQFRTIKHESDGELVVDAWSRWVQSSYAANRTEKYIVHCTNGDIIIE